MAVSRLPTEKQAEILDAGTVMVYGDSPDGRPVPLTALTARETNMVIGPDGVRTAERQRAWLSANPLTAKTDGVPCRADKHRGGLVIGDVFIPLDTIEKLLAELRG